jgi:Flp pilus assembly protein TadD
MATRFENAPTAVLSYLEKLFVPVDLCAIYPLREHIPVWEVTLAVGVLVVISVMGWRWRTSRPYFLMGWLWFLGTLVPVIGLVQVGSQAMADRYMYIPSIGFFIALVFLALELAERLQTPRVIQAGVAAVICAACILGTERQLPYWQNSEPLFRRALAVTKDNDVAHLNLGATLAAQGRYDEALVEFNAARQIRSGWYQVYNNIGLILDADGRPAEAVAEFRQAIQLDARIPYLHNSLGAALAELGQYEEAQREFAEAERLDPQYPWPHVETAKLLLAQGHDMQALVELRMAIQLQPDNDEILAYTAHVLAANKNATLRDGQAALMFALKANVLNGHKPVVLDALGMALADNGDYTNAVLCAQSALELARAARMKETNAMQQRLEFYKLNQPWRESFLATNLPARPEQLKSP